MSDSKKYYYLKLKADFFESDSMIMLESMTDGYKYSNILLKLYLRSLKNEGKLMFNDRIPYNATILAQVTRHSIGDMERAISIFKELDLIEVLDNGAIFITDIQNFIGQSSTEADRKRAYRNKIETEKQMLLHGDVIDVGQMSGQNSDKSPPEKEIDIEIDIDIKKERKNRKQKPHYDESSPYFILATFFLEQIRINKPNYREPNIQSWSDTLRLIVEQDNRTLEQLQKLILWVQRNDFWKANILSPAKLRKQLDTLEMQMEQESKRGKRNNNPYPSDEDLPDWIKDDKRDYGF